MTDTKFYKHPDYSLMRPDWMVIKDFYEGKHDKLTEPDYLWKHEFEEGEGGRKLWIIRQRRSRYVNRLKMVLGRYVSMLFKNFIDTSEIEELFGDELDDIDGKGTSFDNFVKDVALQYFKDGKPIISIDSYPIQAGSLREERDLGLRPYMELLPALELKDWKIETEDPKRNGRYNLLRLEYAMLEDREDLSTEPVERMYSKVYKRENTNVTIERYKGPVAGDYTEGNDKWVKDGEDVSLKIDEIPFAIFTTEPRARDLISDCMLLHNTQSMLDNANLFQGIRSIIYSGKPKKGETIVMNEANVTVIPENAVVTIVEPSYPQALFTRFEQLKLELLQVAFGRERVLPSDSKQSQAADSASEDKTDFIADMKDAGNDIQNLVNNAVKTYAALKGTKDYQKEVRFDLDITIEDVEQSVNIIRSHWDEIKGHETWRKEVNKKIATSQNLTKIDDIVKEIDDHQPEQQANILAPLTSLKEDIVADENSSADQS